MFKCFECNKELDVDYKSVMLSHNFKSLHFHKSCFASMAGEDFMENFKTEQEQNGLDVLEEKVRKATEPYIGDVKDDFILNKIKANFWK